jgi:Xaa-Pro aminopeptidase
MRIAPAEILAARVERLRASLAARQLDALVVTSLPNIAYLTGFFASAANLVVTRDTLQVIGDGRYATALTERVHAFDAITPTVIEPGATDDEAIVTALSHLPGVRAGFEARHLTVHRHRAIEGRLARDDRPDPTPRWSGNLVETDGIVEELRLTKDSWEIGRLREGAGRLSEVAKCILLKALAGRTESDVAGEVEAGLRRAGFERPAFDTIVASGRNAALPHARASQRQIAAGDLVIIDFGGIFDGYCTDLTRTVVASGAPGALGASGALGAVRQRQLIERVIEAQQAAFEALEPGRQPEAADQAARQMLARHGLAEAFTHGTGHGLGLEVHEGPRVTRARADRAEPPLAPGMVMTLEPGVYFPGWGGVRIEDDVLVTKVGAEWLTDVPRTL